MFSFEVPARSKSWSSFQSWRFLKINYEVKKKDWERKKRRGPRKNSSVVDKTLWWNTDRYRYRVPSRFFKHKIIIQDNQDSISFSIEKLIFEDNQDSISWFINIKLISQDTVNKQKVLLFLHVCWKSASHHIELLGEII